MFRVKRQDEAINVFDEGLGKVCVNFLEFRLEVCECFGFVMYINDKLGKSLVVHSSVIIYLLGDFGDEGEEFEIVEVILGHGGQREELLTNALLSCGVM